MTTGMLWFDNDPQRKITEKINQAARYYLLKYGSQPTLCFVHPKLQDTSFENELGLEVQYNAAISPDHIWIGSRSY
jgi:hypothetical protein